MWSFIVPSDITELIKIEFSVAVLAIAVTVSVNVDYVDVSGSVSIHDVSHVISNGDTSGDAIVDGIDLRKFVCMKKTKK